MTKIGSDLFKISHHSQFFADSESEIRFSKKNLKKSQKPKNTIFVPCIPAGILFQIKKKQFFSNSALSN